MKTLTDIKKKEYTRIQRNSSTQELSKKEPVAEETDINVQMIPMAPSFLGISMWKFFVVKDKK
jgi:hypothetical protein